MQRVSVVPRVVVNELAGLVWRQQTVHYIQAQPSMEVGFILLELRYLRVVELEVHLIQAEAVQQLNPKLVRPVDAERDQGLAPESLVLLIRVLARQRGLLRGRVGHLERHAVLGQDRYLVALGDLEVFQQVLVQGLERSTLAEDGDTLIAL